MSRFYQCATVACFMDHGCLFSKVNLGSLPHLTEMMESLCPFKVLFIGVCDNRTCKEVRNRQEVFIFFVESHSFFLRKACSRFRRTLWLSKLMKLDTVRVIYLNVEMEDFVEPNVIFILP